MVTNSTIKTDPYTCDGVQTEFSFSFRAVDADAIVVYLDGVKTTSGYAVTVEDDGIGGTVTMNSAPASGVKLEVVSDVPATQETELQNNTPFFAKVIERSFDKLTLLAAQLEYQVGRAIKVPWGSSETGDELVESLLGAEEGASTSATNAASSATAAAGSATAAAGSATTATTQASAASTSATNAASSATAAAGSATAAAGSATTATTQASAASTSATNAASSATAASTSATNAAESAAEAAASAAASDVPTHNAATDAHSTLFSKKTGLIDLAASVLSPDPNPTTSWTAPIDCWAVFQMPPGGQLKAGSVAFWTNHSATEDQDVILPLKAGAVINFTTGPEIVYYLPVI